jgi:pimeloyl-[acyl-carrier protein] methyl ester esterase
MDGHSETSSPGWILLRGLVREARHWEGFPARLAEALGEPARALDLPGNGELWREASPVSIDAMVESLREQLQAQESPGPYRVLAISLGGMVALGWGYGPSATPQKWNVW